MPTDFDLHWDTSPEALVQSHQAFAHAIAGRIGARLPKHLDRNDLRADAMVGLWSAARRFDRARGQTFTRFAGARIRGAIIDGLRKLHWGGQRPKRAGMRSLRVHSINIDSDAIPAPSSERRLDTHDALAALLLPAPPRLRVIAILRYVAELRPTDIAKAMGISGPRVTQLHHRMIEHMRKSLTA